ncbi:hypothetical protein DVH26_17410 [Paenibacillus sp. H1-7]|uniref:hypothetical protein n=1 Tax=Paenibacillus sp. H1-7 TaxID=2282849 RepID=UPI001EF9A392|nr:hypothetical protein [Paenibacillus sp. H1-7]ULL16069.1 hypothetical protein DVH26_17410 [Paenibacillus sp. H1-7]
MTIKRIIASLIYAVLAAIYLYGYKLLNLIIDEFDSSFSMISVTGILLPFGLAVVVMVIVSSCFRSVRMKSAFIGLSLLLFLTPVLYSVSKLTANERQAVNPLRQAELAKRFKEALRGGTDGAPISMASVAPFDWDRLIVFGPYVSPSEVNGKLGYTWTRSSFLNSNETDYTILFVNNGKVVQSLYFAGSVDPAILGTFWPNDVMLAVDNQQGTFRLPHLKKYKEEKESDPG